MRQDDLFEFSEKLITKQDTEQVILAVCAYFGVSQQQMQDRTRSVRLGNKDHNIAIAKKCLMYILRVHVQLTLEEIAKFFNFKEHSNVHHHVEDFRKYLREGNRPVNEGYIAVLAMLGNSGPDTHRIANFCASDLNAQMSRDMIRNLCHVDRFLHVYGYRLALVKKKRTKDDE